MLVAQTSERVGLPPQAVEKDWWVTMTLKALFESSCRDFITFKGGTSLSKGWHVIERFSEDVDIAIDKSFWGIAGDNKSQRDRIRKLSRAYIGQDLVAEMRTLLAEYGASDFELRVVPTQDSDADPTLVLLPYRSIYADIDYVESQIRIEFSCRSMQEPRERIEIRPLIAEAYPNLFGKLEFPIYAVVPTRTFLEKAFLLHEEFQKENPRVERMTRHLYDLERLMDTDFGRRLWPIRKCMPILSNIGVYSIRSEELIIGHTIRAGSSLFRPKNWWRYGAKTMSGCRNISSMENRCHTIS